MGKEALRPTSNISPMSNRLHIAVHGEGTPLVLLHGWGLHGGVWSPAIDALSRRHRLYCVDLPGFGASSPLETAYSAKAMAEAITDAVPKHAAWMGWSLGGLVALAAAAGGGAISRLILVATTPSFVQRPDWPHAMAPEVLANFAGELAADYRATVLRFLALQARGSEHARDELRDLRETVFARGEPALAALRGGLEILATTDLRASLAHIDQPTLVIQGERDVLVPQAAAKALASTLPSARLANIKGAGHAPFLSHTNGFTETVLSYLDE